VRNRHDGAVDREEWNERYAGAELVWSAQANRFLVAEVESLPPGRALDLACGEGRNAVWLAERGWSVTGVDFADVGLAKARRLAAARGVEVEWVDADVLDWEPPAAAFDLVVLLYLQLPVHERRVVHGRAAAAVASGGTLLVVAHHATNPADGYGGPKDPAVLFTEDDVVGDLLGLEIVRAERVQRPVATAEGEAVALDVLVRAARP
jgi:SAM-dependent methyltransferase